MLVDQIHHYRREDGARFEIRERVYPNPDGSLVLESSAHASMCLHRRSESGAIVGMREVEFEILDERGRSLGDVAEAARNLDRCAQAAAERTIKEIEAAKLRSRITAGVVGG